MTSDAAQAHIILICDAAISANSRHQRIQRRAVPQRRAQTDAAAEPASSRQLMLNPVYMFRRSHAAAHPHRVHRRARELRCRSHLRFVSRAHQRQAGSAACCTHDIPRTCSSIRALFPCSGRCRNDAASAQDDCLNKRSPRASCRAAQAPLALRGREAARQLNMRGLPGAVASARRRRNVPVRLVNVRNFGHQRVVRVRVSQQRADGQQHLARGLASGAGARQFGSRRSVAAPPAAGTRRGPRVRRSTVRLRALQAAARGAASWQGGAAPAGVPC